MVDTDWCCDLDVGACHSCESQRILATTAQFMINRVFITAHPSGLLTEWLAIREAGIPLRPSSICLSQGQGEYIRIREFAFNDTNWCVHLSPDCLDTRSVVVIQASG